MDERLVSGSTTIAATPDVVFAIVADPRQHPRIDGSGSVRGVLSGPDRLAEGESFGVSMRLFGVPYTIRNRVVEFEEGRLIAWRHFAGHRWRYELEPTPDGGTRVTETFDYTRYHPVSVIGLRAAGFPERNRAGIAETLVRLKRAAEDDQAASRAERPAPGPHPTTSADPAITAPTTRSTTPAALRANRSSPTR